MTTANHLAGAIARLALNYGRHMDAEALAGTLDTWQGQLGRYEAEDVDDAVTRVLGDANVRTMPTVAAIAHLCAESQARRQRSMARPDEAGTVACTTCDDSGWLDAGSDEDGYEYVGACPKGCLPPLPGSSRQHTARRRRRQPSHQGKLADTLPADAIDAQHRLIGDGHERLHPHDERF